MNDRFELNIKRLWLAASVFSLVFPFALNSLELSAGVYSYWVEAGIIALFALTLPSSFFSLPLLALFKYILEIDTGEMFGAYLYIALLNIIGYVQWFRLMPVFFGKAKPLKFVSIVDE